VLLLDLRNASTVEAPRFRVLRKYYPAQTGDITPCHCRAAKCPLPNYWAIIYSFIYSQWINIRHFKWGKSNGKGFRGLLYNTGMFQRYAGLLDYPQVISEEYKELHQTINTKVINI
jgi:hypothetical protein